MARKFKDWGDAHVAGIKVRKVADEAWAKAGPEQGQGNENDETAADTIDIAMWPIMQSKAMHGIVGEIASWLQQKRGRPCCDNRHHVDVGRRRVLGAASSCASATTSITQDISPALLAARRRHGRARARTP